MAVPHCVALLQSTQAPEPLQKSPEPHAKSAGRLGLLGVPALHTSLVQAFPSTGRSVLKTEFTTAPEPLHSCTRQSPLDWLPAGKSVPAAVLVVWQTPALHAKAWQKVLVPQSAAVMHSTQSPAPSQMSPPMVQLASGGLAGLLGTPLLHRSSVHSFPSTGRSLFSATLRVAPMPLHSTTWQSPLIWLPPGRSVPTAVLLVPQLLLEHVNV